MATIWDKSRAAARKLRSELSKPDSNGISIKGTAKEEIQAEVLVSDGLESAGLRCRLRLPSDPLLSGAHAVLDPEMRTIWVRSDASAPERRVFIAHELAHLHLQEGGKLCHCSEPYFAEPEAMRSAAYGPRQPLKI